MTHVPSEDERPIAVLVVDDEESMRHFVSRALKRRGFETTSAASAQEALEALEGRPIDVVVTDIRMPGMTGRELAEEVRVRAPGTGVILMTAFGTIRDAVEAMSHGVESYLTKPFETDELLAVVSKAAEKARLSSENQVLRRLLAERSFGGLVGSSRAMRALYQTIQLVSKRTGAVLLTGESGTGKELVARAIHQRSHRVGPFVAVHCGALPAGLIEAELFGVTEGAFTGADHARAGYVERAQGGTLFLDEVSEIPPEQQAKLLRFLESGEVFRVGGTEGMRSDARVIAASNRNLRELLEQRKFRDDLFYRLNVLPVSVPPLRDRREDIPLLLTHFLEAAGREDLQVPPDVLAHIQALPFPGNVRELRNLAERLAATVEGATLELKDVPGEVAALDSEPTKMRPYREALERFERKYLEALLERTAGNVSEAARLGGLARPSLHARIGALGIEVERFRGRKA